MPILPNNTDPLQDYVAGGLGGSLPPLTLDGLVYNRVYAQTGVVDTLTNTGKTGYTDPSTNIINGRNNQTVFDQVQENSWISSQQFGGPNSPPVLLTFNFNTETDVNAISFDVLNVPCYVELGTLDDNNNFSALPGSSTFSINGGNDIYTTTEFVRLDYLSPFDPVTQTTALSLNNLLLRITRTNAVQAINNGILSDVAYCVGVQALTARLQVTQSTDIPSNVISGTQTINTQNRFGFLENYTYENYPVNNMFVNDETYWKSAPQPTGDSVVYFYACVGDPTPQVINRLYIDPLYSGCRFNIYFTDQTTASGTIDPDTFTWTPINRDFTLRKGVYELPSTAATYLKFEFVKLIPEAYDLPFDTVTRVINVFPSEIEEYYYQLESQIIDGNSVQYSWLGNNNNPQTITSTNINSSTLFGLSSNTLTNPNTWPQLSALNNSQLGGNTTTVGNNTNSYIIDPTQSYKTVDQNGNYNGAAYNQFLQRRFPNIQQHSYTQNTIEQCWHEAYFTGIQYLTAFYEKQFDDLLATPENIIALQTDGFTGSNVNYVGLDVDDQAITPWFPTLETFKSFNIGALTNDWHSFLTDEQVLMNDPANYNNLANATATPIGNLGSSTIVQISQINQGFGYSIQSASYRISQNMLYYDDANFTTIDNWTAGSGTTIASTNITWVSGTNSGTAYGMSISGGSYSATYNFAIPDVGYGGEQPWLLQFGSPAMGVFGYGEYNPVTSGTSYYFYTGVQVSGTASGISTVNGTISSSTKFYNPVTQTVVSGTTVSGSTVTFASGVSNNINYVTATNFTASGLPAGTIQFTVSGNGVGKFNVYELGVFPVPTTSWITPEDRNYMRISSLDRIMLPFTNNGSYHVCLCAFDANGNEVQLTCQDFGPGMLPINTWIEIRLTAFTYQNYNSFYTRVEQMNGDVSEIFYVSALSPFYHPVRFEYTTISGGPWQYITGNINDPSYFINTTRGMPASGIQLRMTALDPNIFISGISVVPYYKSNPYYADLTIDYIGNSKTNELSARTAVANKPFFQNNPITYPEVFSIPVVVGPNVGYIVEQFGY